MLRSHRCHEYWTATRITTTVEKSTAAAIEFAKQQREMNRQFVSVCVCAMAKQWAFIDVGTRSASIELSPIEICYVMGYEKQLNHSNFFVTPSTPSNQNPNQNTLHTRSYLQWIKAIVRCNPSIWFLVFCCWFDSTFSDLLFLSPPPLAFSPFCTTSFFPFLLFALCLEIKPQSTISFVCFSVTFCRNRNKYWVNEKAHRKRKSIDFKRTNHAHIPSQRKNGTSNDLVYQSGKTEMYHFNFVTS